MDIVGKNSSFQVHLRILECKFKFNSTPKVNSRNKGYPSLIYSNLVLFLTDAELRFFQQILLTRDTKC